jgi:molecular chaperone IbpA
MRTTYDFAPLWRSTIGFDRLFDLVDAAQHGGAEDTIHPATSNVWAKTATRYLWRSRVSRRTISRSPRNRAC